MFAKKDLRNGMVVETRDECRYIVIGDRLLAEDGFLYFHEYDDNLLDVDGEGSAFDVMKVFDKIDNLSYLRKYECALKCLFNRNDSEQTQKTNDDRAKYFCKEFANIYGLDESKLYDRFLRILYEVSGRKVCITETVINEAVRELGKECSTYYIIKRTEKD